MMDPQARAEGEVQAGPLGALRSALRLARRELGVALRTFVVAWPALAVALVLWAELTSPPAQTTRDPLEYAGVFAISLFYVFWPAVVVAACRVAYRLIGWSAFVPLPVMALGSALALWAASGWLQALVNGVLAAANGMGPCAAHAGGSSPVAALGCLGLALVSPAGVFAVLKLLLAVVFLFALGSAPGLLLGGALIAVGVRRRLAGRR